MLQGDGECESFDPLFACLRTRDAARASPLLLPFLTTVLPKKADDFLPFQIRPAGG